MDINLYFLYIPFNLYTSCLLCRGCIHLIFNLKRSTIGAGTELHRSSNGVGRIMASRCRPAGGMLNRMSFCPAALFYLSFHVKRYVQVVTAHAFLARPPVVFILFITGKAAPGAYRVAKSTAHCLLAFSAGVFRDHVNTAVLPAEKCVVYNFAHVAGVTCEHGV